MNYKEELNNIASELKRQSDMFLTPLMQQNNALLQALVTCLNANKTRIAEYNAKLNTYGKYTIEDIAQDLEAQKECFFVGLCIDNIVKENESIQKQIDELLKLYK